MRSRTACGVRVLEREEVEHVADAGAGASVLVAGAGVPGVEAVLDAAGPLAICGLLVFQLTESLPGVVSRGRETRRSGLRRRQW